MQVTETLSEGLKRSYAVTVPAAEIESRTTSRLTEIGKTLRLPGFRPGKVPANLVRQRFGTQVMAEIMQSAVSDAAERVVEDSGLRPAGQPRISLAREPKLGVAAEDLEIKVELEVLPEITLPDLHAVSLTRLKAEPAPDIVAKALESLARQYRDVRDIAEERGAQDGDVLTVDFTGTIDGAAFEGGAAKEARIELGGTDFIPGFAEQLAGMRPQETRTIEVTFPADYATAQLAGKAAQFVVDATALGEFVEVPQDDALAAKIGFEHFAGLEEAIRAQMQTEYDQMSRLRLKRELLDILAGQAAFEAPPSMLETEFNAIWQRVQADRAQGQQDEDDVGKDEETLRAEYRAIADRRVRLGLMLAEIGRVNDVQVTPAELSTALRNEAARYPGQEVQVVEFFRKTPGAVEQLRGPIFEDKVVDHILSVAQVDEKTVAPEDLTMPEVGLASAVISGPAVEARDVEDAGSEDAGSKDGGKPATETQSENVEAGTPTQASPAGEPQGETGDLVSGVVADPPAASMPPASVHASDREDSGHEGNAAPGHAPDDAA